MPLKFSTKAETLERVAALVRKAVVLPQRRCTVHEWKERGPAFLEAVLSESWGAGELIVRSSACVEDGGERSFAGEFLSVPAVSGRGALEQAIDAVIRSFGSQTQEDQVFVQPMLRDVAANGVAFSRDPSNGAPYRVISFDDTSGTTDAVTSGTTNELHTYYVYRLEPRPIPGLVDEVVGLLEELEKLFATDALDVEFALTRDGQLHLLQVRRLALPNDEFVEPGAHVACVRGISRKLETLIRRHPYLHGTRSVFGVMPDWNPAEIVGIRPRPLALSLYKELVTDNIWAYQRDNYGYRNLRSFPLLVSLGGLPYIDVRVSFNSFIPADVDSVLAEKLANYYLECLASSPSYHDKVEFEIIHSCYTLDLAERLQQLLSAGFTAAEVDRLRESLRRLTNRIIHGEKGLWRGDIERIHELERRRPQILDSHLDDVGKMYWLIEDCKRYGTLPFAGLARAGFIAVQLLRSLVTTGILDAVEYQSFMSSLDTVSSGMTADFATLGRDAFLEKYGHLRPGTYDILSPRYDEAPDRYFDWSAQAMAHSPRGAPFSLSLEQMRRTKKLLDEHGLEHDVLGLFEFIKAAIEGREYAKFIFTKSLSDVLTLFGRLGAEHGFSSEDCAYAHVECVRTLYGSSSDPRQVLAGSIAQGRTAHAMTRQINLPALITDASDVFGFRVPGSDPNFITMGQATGRVAFPDHDRQSLRGTILLIPSADPGFDWIFATGIAGFITMFGGANSHMAIRAAELGVPAVIGAGETLFNTWSKAGSLELDCANRQVKVLR